MGLPIIGEPVWTMTWVRNSRSCISAMLGGDRFALREQLAADGEHVDEADGGVDDAELGELEHGKRLLAERLCLAVDDEVGRGAGERAGAAEDAGERERDEEARGFEVGGFGEAQDDGQEDDDDGRVVDEGGEDGAGDHEDDEHAQFPFAGDAAEPAPHDVDAAGALEPGAEDEHAGDGDRGGVAECAEHLILGEDPGGEHQARGKTCDHVRRQPFAEECQPREAQ